MNDFISSNGKLEDNLIKDNLETTIIKENNK